MLNLRERGEIEDSIEEISRLALNYTLKVLLLWRAQLLLYNKERMKLRAYKRMTLLYLLPNSAIGHVFTSVYLLARPSRPS
jgi:hypothetical protein